MRLPTILLVPVLLFAQGSPHGFVTLNRKNTQEVTTIETVRVEHWWYFTHDGMGEIRVSFPQTDMIHPHCKRPACAMNVIDLQQPKVGVEITDYDKEGFTIHAPRGHYIEIHWVSLQSTGPGDHFNLRSKEK